MIVSRKPGLKYVWRGDVTDADLSDTEMTVDDAWHDWNVAAIVPANAKVVTLYVELVAGGAGAHFAVGPEGIVHLNSGDICYLQIGGGFVCQTIRSPISTNGILRYRAGGWVPPGDQCFVYVTGWWI